MALGRALARIRRPDVKILHRRGVFYVPINETNDIKISELCEVIYRVHDKVDFDVEPSYIAYNSQHLMTPKYSVESFFFYFVSHHKSFSENETSTSGKSRFLSSICRSYFTGCVSFSRISCRISDGKPSTRCV